MSVEQVLGLYNYWVVVFLMMTGFYIVIARGNLIKSVIGLNIFQTSVFLLYITMGKIDGATAPIIPPMLVASHGSEAHGADGHDIVDHAIVEHRVLELNAPEQLSHGDGAADLGHTAEHVTDHAADASLHATDLLYSNPLPSVLMLTAIVVGIATTALALALVVRIREDYGTIEEDEILELDRNS